MDFWEKASSGKALGTHHEVLGDLLSWLVDISFSRAFAHHRARTTDPSHGTAPSAGRIAGRRGSPKTGVEPKSNELVSRRGESSNPCGRPSNSGDSDARPEPRRCTGDQLDRPGTGLCNGGRRPRALLQPTGEHPPHRPRQPGVVGSAPRRLRAAVVRTGF